MIYHAEPYLFAALLYFLLLLTTLRFLLPQVYDLKPASRFLLAACLAITIQVLMTAKHPAPRYIVPVLVVPSFVVAILIDVFLKLRPLRRPAVLIFGLGGIVLALGLMRSVSAINEWEASRNAYREEVRKIALAGPKNDCLRVGFYQSWLPEFALAFGNDWSGGVHATLLQSLYPQTLTFNIFEGRLYSFGGVVPAIEIQRRIEYRACILAQGNPQFDGLSEFSEIVVASPVYTGAHESLFLLASKRLSFVELMTNL